jgi:hypothetical protein
MLRDHDAQQQTLDHSDEALLSHHQTDLRIMKR